MAVRENRDFFSCWKKSGTLSVLAYSAVRRILFWFPYFNSITQCWKYPRWLPDAILKKHTDILPNAVWSRFTPPPFWLVKHKHFCKPKSYI